MHIVYVIQHDLLKDLYIGRTTGLEQRLKDHNSGRNAATYRKNGKWILIYAEAYRNRQDAIDRELKLKQHGSSKHELYKRLKHSLL